MRNYFEHDRIENIKRGTIKKIQKEQLKDRNIEMFNKKLVIAAKLMLEDKIFSPFLAADVHSTMSRIGYPIDLSKTELKPDEHDEAFRIGIRKNEHKKMNSWKKGVKFKKHLTNKRREMYYISLKEYNIDIDI